MCRRDICLSFIIILFVALASTSGEFIVTHSPNHVRFLGKANILSTSEIPDVISSYFGFPISKDLEWNGLEAGNLWKRPLASVLVSVDTVQDLPLKLQQLHSYATAEDDPDIDTELFTNRLQSAHFSKEPLLVDFSVDKTVLEVKSQHPHLFKSLPATFEGLHNLLEGRTDLNFGSLNASNDVDIIYMGELHLMSAMTQTLKGSDVVEDSTPDFYHFKVSGLKKLVEVYGASSQQAADGAKLLSQVLHQVTEHFKELYHGNLVIQVVTLHSEKIGAKHQGRRILEEAEPKPKKDDFGKVLNLAPEYDEMYPVAFNIILWLMILLALAVFYISYGLWYMDPGRDSIIYRMTSTRMKKD